ncbi:deoxyribodipyrimidine photo-lyase [Nitrosomonas supralitoralis]|uniref:deoxyribodipyrimidine photo-lyase n=1 Tax=Nitrosomonas supralitoralis TaxID=2116706 RepID=UPI0018D4E129|nr:deoxyribodipyrimidine photo-lyase [Nitrosomonas supralitoralis]
MAPQLAVFWFRRDLRPGDKVGFSHALASEHPVLMVFIFDPSILTGLPENDARYVHLRYLANLAYTA